MALKTDGAPAGRRSDLPSAPRSSHAAATAAARVWTAGFALGGLGLGLSLFVVWRLLLSWRVTPQSAAHDVSILGHRLSYPAANLDAVVILVLAAVGLVVVAMTILGSVRELAADRSFRRGLAAAAPRPLNDALVIDDERPKAFCAGLFHPRVYVSSGAVARLMRAPWTPCWRTRPIMRAAVTRYDSRSAESSLAPCFSSPACTNWFADSRLLVSSALTRVRLTWLLGIAQRWPGRC
jgi:hypothetical protein